VQARTKLGVETMKYVPSLPPVVTGVTDRLDVYALTRVKPVKPVQERTLVPLVVHPHGEVKDKPGASEDVAEQPVRRHDPHLQGERRVYCRRVKQQPILIELRSGPDRRRHNQRGSDTLDHVDVEA
jgi:hypothetical protein